MVFALDQILLFLLVKDFLNFGISLESHQPFNWFLNKSWNRIIIAFPLEINTILHQSTFEGHIGAISEVGELTEVLVEAVDPEFNESAPISWPIDVTIVGVQTEADIGAWLKEFVILPVPHFSTIGFFQNSALFWILLVIFDDIEIFGQQIVDGRQIKLFAVINNGRILHQFNHVFGVGFSFEVDFVPVFLWVQVFGLKLFASQETQRVERIS